MKKARWDSITLARVVTEAIEFIMNNDFVVFEDQFMPRQVMVAQLIASPGGQNLMDDAAHAHVEREKSKILAKSAVLAPYRTYWVEKSYFMISRKGAEFFTKYKNLNGALYPYSKKAEIKAAFKNTWKDEEFTDFGWMLNEMARNETAVKEAGPAAFPYVDGHELMRAVYFNSNQVDARKWYEDGMARVMLRDELPREEYLPGGSREFQGGAAVIEEEEAA
jgi:hypothetical protein